MKRYEPSPDLLIALLRPDATFDERKAAILRFAEEAWGHGWDECFEETLAILARYDSAHLVEGLRASVH